MYAPRDSKRPAKYDMDTVPGLAEEFADAIPSGAFSPAQIHEYLLQYRVRPAIAIAKAESWAEQQLGKSAFGAKEEHEAREPAAASPQGESSNWVKGLSRRSVPII